MLVACVVYFFLFGLVACSICEHEEKEKNKVKAKQENKCGKCHTNSPSEDLNLFPTKLSGVVVQTLPFHPYYLSLSNTIFKLVLKFKSKQSRNKLRCHN